MMMVKLTTLLLLILSVNGAVHSQDSNPKLLRDALHCLVSSKRDWLGLQKSGEKVLEVSYVIDRRSDPGVAHLYVVVYTDAKHSKGLAFDLLFMVKGGSTVLDIQNNASFEISHKEITFVNPPLGGTWTETQLMSAIGRAGKRSSRKFIVDDLSLPSHDVTCKCYADGK